MKGYTPNPTIRILMLGAEGVGKNCIESRFTTNVYPPPYNPALTLNSRRFFTLTPVHDGDSLSDGHHGAAQQAADKTAATSASSQTSPSTPSFDLDTRTLVNAAASCDACVRESNTYLVEVINYPALHNSARVRKQVHSKADYDAVLLVYDVCARSSYDAITALHAEIPVCRRTTRSRTTGWFSGGGSDVTGHTGSGEIVVGLIGNKGDVAETATGYPTHLIGNRGGVTETPTGHELVEETSCAKTSDDSEATARDSLSSPLYHASIMYEELMARRAREQHETANTESPRAPDIVGTLRTQPEQEGADAAESLYQEDIQKWLQISRLEPQLEPHPEPTHAPPPCPARTASSAAAAAAPSASQQRQVSACDGEALARQLHLAVPFCETSAKTGAQVELVFEHVVRAVLREMGRDASGTNKAGKTCRHKANLVKVKSAESAASLGVEEAMPLPNGVAKDAVISVATASSEECEKRSEATAVPSEGVPIVGAETASSGGSKMGRVRKMLMRRGHIAV